MINHEEYMTIALEEAKIAFLEGEVPVGAVCVKDGKILSRAHNARETANDPTGHAEILAIRSCAEVLGDWRLDGVTLYVTLEPCCMCAGAIISSRIDTVVYGAPDPSFGCMGSKINLAHLDFGSTPKIQPNVLKDDCRKILTDFFERKR